MRVVSLVPSLTETVMAWGVVPVAVTRFCEQPGLPSVGGTKNPDLGEIVRLAPDLVLMDREENRRPDADALAAAGVPLHVTHVRSLADVAPTLAGLAGALGLRGAPGEGSPLPAVPDTARPVLRAFIPVWRRPWMSLNAETYGSSLLAAVGVANVLADRDEPYPVVDLDEVAALRPDVVLAPSEPYPFSSRHAGLFEGVAPMVPVDGKDLFWWGVRTAGALARLRALVRRLRGAT